MSILHIIEIFIFVIGSFGIYKCFRNNKYPMINCMAVIAVLFLVLLLQFVIFPGNSGPSIEFGNGDKVFVQVGTEYNESDITAEDGFTDLTHLLRKDVTPDTSKTGTYKVRYILNYENEIYYKERIVCVIDESGSVAEVKDKNNAVSGGNYKKAISSSVTVVTEKQKDGKYLNTYVEEDLSGGTTYVKKIVETFDDSSPEITLKGNRIKVIMAGENYTDEGVTAIDNIDGDISSKVKSSCGGIFKGENAGVYKITYTVEDAAGNKATATRMVHVLNKIGNDPRISKTDDGKGVVCLTFDDGPSVVTIKNLDTLKEYGVKATFFIVDHNYTESTKPIIERIIKEGHTLALHDGNSHNYGKTYSSETSYLEGITKLHDNILNDFGYDARIVRFPGGTSNAIARRFTEGLMNTLPKLMLDNGYLFYDWNVDSTDATEKNGNNPAAIYNNVVKDLKQGRINVVLMHDIASKTATSEALDDIIKYGINNGYIFEAITEDTPLVCHNATNA